MDLVDTMDRVFDFTEDVTKVQEHIKDDTTRLETIITAMLNQVSECAIFVCEYLRPSFVGMSYHSLSGILGDNMTYQWISKADETTYR